MVLLLQWSPVRILFVLEQIISIVLLFRTITCTSFYLGYQQSLLILQQQRHQQQQLSIITQFTTTRITTTISKRTISKRTPISTMTKTSSSSSLSLLFNHYNIIQLTWGFNKLTFTKLQQQQPQQNQNQILQQKQKQQQQQQREYFQQQQQQQEYYQQQQQQNQQVLVSKLLLSFLFYFLSLRRFLIDSMKEWFVVFSTIRHSYENSRFIENYSINTTTTTTTNTNTTINSTIIQNQTKKTNHNYSQSDVIWKILPPNWNLDDIRQLSTKPLVDNNNNTMNWKIHTITTTTKTTPITIHSTFGKNTETSVPIDNNNNDITMDSLDSLLSYKYGGSGKAILVVLDKLTNVLLGRFGFTTQPGPYIPLIQETIQSLFSNERNNNTTSTDYQENYDGVGAIQYMFVEEAYRGRNIGTLALEMISYIHATVGCHYTLLVADDKTPLQSTITTSPSRGKSSTSNNSTGHDKDDSTNTIDSITKERYDKPPYEQQSKKLVSWYETNGKYKVAYSLQDLVGSPNGLYGIAMIGPARLDALSPSNNNKNNSNDAVQLHILVPSALLDE